MQFHEKKTSTQNLSNSILTQANRPLVLGTEGKDSLYNYKAANEGGDETQLCVTVSSDVKGPLYGKDRSENEVTNKMAVGSSRNVEAIERQASVQKEQGIEVSDTSQETSASVQGNKEETSPLNFRSLKNSSKYTLMLLASANFAHMTAFSLLAPFFPKEALKKGTSQTVIGLIFSVFEFVVFFTAPVYGANLMRIGPRFMFVSGILVAGVCAILFGVLEYCPGGAPFITLCFLTRFVEALGMSAFSTASFAIASSQFPDRVATVFGIMETATSLGFMVGPAIGSFLYEAGGFGLPFYVIGSFILLNGALVCGCLPESTDLPEKRHGSKWRLSRSGLVWLTLFAVTCAAFGNGFIDANLALHAEKVGVSIFYTGLLFSLWPVLYALSAPVWGWLCDSKGKAFHLLILGNLGTGLGFLIVGPSPLISFVPSSPWTIVVALAVCGVSVSACFLPCMKCLVIGASDVGFEDNIDTFGLVSGMFQAAFAFGASCGPAIGGAVVDSLGFPTAASFMTGLLWTVSLSWIVYVIFRFKIRKEGNGTNIATSHDHLQLKFDGASEERQPLLHESRDFFSSLSYTISLPRQTVRREL